MFAALCRGDFAGEEAACGLLTFGDVALARHSEQAPSALALCNVATAIEIGHSQILLELIYCHTFFLLRFYNLFTSPFERRGKNNQKVKIEVWYCPLSYLIRYSFDTDTILMEWLGESVFYGGKEADLKKNWQQK